MGSTYSRLNYHVIFGTRARAPLITAGLRAEHYPYIGGILRGHRCSLLEIGGMPDHLHLAIRAKPDIGVAEMVRLVKANSSKWINERAGDRGRFAWQSGYGAFSVSLSQLPVLSGYIRGQEEHHRTRSFQEEYVDFLRRHGIEFDERYLWD